MHGKLTLSFTLATFIAAIGLLFFLSDVRKRLVKVERDLMAREAVAPQFILYEPADVALYLDLRRRGVIRPKKTSVTT